jgi:hypothetical protein
MNASDKDSSAAKHLSALGASKGGHARAAKLSAKERSRIAQKAARARWGKADDHEEHQPEIIRGKGLFEDASTLAEAAAMLRAEADRLDQLAREGWELEQPAYDDYGFLVQVPALREDDAR